MNLRQITDELEQAMITPISKDDLRYNEGIRTAMAIVEEYYANSEETEETD